MSLESNYNNKSNPLDEKLRKKRKSPDIRQKLSLLSVGTNPNLTNIWCRIIDLKKWKKGNKKNVFGLTSELLFIVT
jgi:hypothetical protein